MTNGTGFEGWLQKYRRLWIFLGIVVILAVIGAALNSPDSTHKRSSANHKRSSAAKPSEAVPNYAVAYRDYMGAHFDSLGVIADPSIGKAGVKAITNDAAKTDKTEAWFFASKADIKKRNIWGYAMYAKTPLGMKLAGFKGSPPHMHIETY